jgi:hypothetical protein
VPAFDLVLLALTCFLLVLIIGILLRAWRRTTLEQAFVDRPDIPAIPSRRSDDRASSPIGALLNDTINTIWSAQEPHDTPAWRKTAALMLATKRYDISTNAAPEALFTTGLGSMPWVCIYCTPDDNPGGLWDQLTWHHSELSQLTKPGKGLADCFILWRPDHQDVLALALQTEAHSLKNAGLVDRSAMENRAEDIAWATKKLEWLWHQAVPDEPLPRIILKWRADDPPDTFEDIWDAAHEGTAGIE